MLGSMLIDGVVGLLLVISLHIVWHLSLRWGRLGELLALFVTCPISLSSLNSI